jgi:hypothetical protein
MPNRFVSVLIASVLSSASAAALAQPAAPQAAASQTAAKPPVSTTVAPVTVQAAPTPKVIEKQSQSFVLSYAASANAEIDQIGRWHDPVCVQAVGLVDAQAAAIKARIEEVAKEVGLPATRPVCATNVEIVFTDQPQAVMDELAKKREYLLGYYHRHEHNQLKKVTRPIQAWYVTATRGEGGSVAGALFGGVSGVQVETDVIDDPENPPPNACGDNPRFTACLKSEFRNVFIVADSKALNGKGAGLLSDYLVMLALSEPKSLDGCNALPSVIDLFAPTACPGRDTPDGLTAADAAYLTALYMSDPEGKKNMEQTDISIRMANILVNASKPAK